MPSEAVLIDTGPLIAFYNRQDPQHAVCRELMDSVPYGKAYTCWPVITEAVYMLRKRSRQRDDLIQSVVAGDLVLQSAQICLFPGENRLRNEHNRDYRTLETGALLA